jgi:hypothetical protein
MAYMNETKKGIGLRMPKKETWQKVGRGVGRAIYDTVDTVALGLKNTSPSRQPKYRR